MSHSTESVTEQNADGRSPQTLHVLCLCPNRHCIGDFKFYQPVHDYALKIMRFAIGDLLSSEQVRPFCDVCEAPAESWFCELAESEEHDSKNTIMGGVSVDQ